MRIVAVIGIAAVTLAMSAAAAQTAGTSAPKAPETKVVTSQTLNKPLYVPTPNPKNKWAKIKELFL